MALATGTRLDPYEVVAPIAAGGLGEVYRARDLTLDRDVALKLLPDAVAADAERLARFEREAKTLAGLNHPHIAQVYGFEAISTAAGAGRALVMELVEGEDLSRILARGPLPIDEAVPIARQIAEALEAAHAQGIVHRDLAKPRASRRDALSPDGRWLAFSAQSGDRHEVFVVPLPPTGQRWQVSTAGGVQPRWHPSGRTLHFLDPNGMMMAVAIAGGATFLGRDAQGAVRHRIQPVIQLRRVPRRVRWPLPGEEAARAGRASRHRQLAGTAAAVGLARRRFRLRQTPRRRGKDRPMNHQVDH